MTDSTNFLDLDAIDTRIDFKVKLNGTVHELKAISVDDFVQNTVDQRKLDGSPDIETEVDVVLTMLVRAFPTMDKEQLRKVELTKLWKLLNFALENNGNNGAKKDVETDAPNTENPQTAG